MRVLTIQITSTDFDTIHTIQSKMIREYHDLLLVKEIIRETDRKMDDYIKQLEKEKTESK